MTTSRVVSTWRVYRRRRQRYRSRRPGDRNRADPSTIRLVDNRHYVNSSAEGQPRRREHRIWTPELTKRSEGFTPARRRMLAPPRAPGTASDRSTPHHISPGNSYGLRRCRPAPRDLDRADLGSVVTASSTLRLCAPPQPHGWRRCRPPHRPSAGRHRDGRTITQAADRPACREFAPRRRTPHQTDFRP
jgi:hypothetical protein